ncbi:MAG: ComF family protein [Nitrospinae bacterium]|nr:ComF family protein [Nitrospinota bacterium]
MVDREGAICSACLSQIPYIDRQTCSICGNILGFDYDPGEILNYTCGECRLHPPPFKKSLSAAPYEGGMKKLLRKFKYDGKEFLGGEIASIIFDRCKEMISGNNFDIMTGVPLHIKALKKRGFDQSFILAEHIGGMSGLSQTPEIIVRIRDTASQTHLRRRERIENVKGAFRLAENAAAIIKGKKILLVDDVSTTGGTIRECAKTLMKGGAKEVSAITAARA